MCTYLLENHHDTQSQTPHPSGPQSPQSVHLGQLHSQHNILLCTRPLIVLSEIKNNKFMSLVILMYIAYIFLDLYTQGAGSNPT